MTKDRRKYYPKDWERIADACKRAAGWKCEWCKVRHGTERISNRTGRSYRAWMHAAHVSLNDTMNPQPQLMCLCPSCHGSYDYHMRVREGIVNL